MLSKEIIRKAINRLTYLYIEYRIKMSETLNKKIINQTKIEQIKIPENQLQKLNRFIEKNLQNRKNGTNYNLLYKISEITKRKIKISNRQIKKITTTSSKEQTKNITLEFFKELD